MAWTTPTKPIDAWVKGNGSPDMPWSLFSMPEDKVTVNIKKTNEISRKDVKDFAKSLVTGFRLSFTPNSTDTSTYYTPERYLQF